MTYDEAKDGYRECDFVALVTASHEQHSTHLPLLTDSIIGEYFAKRLAEEAESKGIRILLLPTLWLGYSEEHANWPGTILLGPDTLKSVLLEIAGSLKRHGVKRFLIINSHGGNTPVLQLTVDRIERDLGLQTHLLDWLSYGKFPARSAVQEKPEPMKLGHADQMETAMLLRARPDLFRKEKTKAPILRPRAISRGWWGAKYWDILQTLELQVIPRAPLKKWQRLSTKTR
ncbi:MAG: creatininase family protein [Thaumarchaeota archaeon]|nr:creatininase family protein [Nitrososphaerota archaeon]